MKVAIIYNKDMTGVINNFGMQNKEIYNPETVKAVADSIEQGGHNLRVLDGNMYLIEKLQDFMPRVIDGERMGMVFNMAYGIQGESRYTHLPSMLEMLGIPYVGSGPEGHALALDKIITKIILQKFSIPTPHFWVFSTGDEEMADVTYPCIVKPKMESVSYGLKVVYNEDDLREAVKHIVHEFRQQALVEQFIRGREFCIGLLGNNEPEVFPVLEIDLNNDPDAIQTETDKLNNPRRKICPANISPELAEKMRYLSKECFRVLGLRDFARVDIRMDMDENIYVLEINSMASMGHSGSYVNAAKAAGYDYPTLVNKILDVASVRYFSESSFYIGGNGGELKNKVPLSVKTRIFLRSRQDQTEKILKQMVGTNTYFRNVERVNTLGRLLIQQLTPLGFSCQILPQVEIGNVHLFTNSNSDEYDILLLGHLDSAVPFTKHIDYHATEHRLYGTDIWDNKGGLVIMIDALKALRYSRILRKKKIAILLISDNSLQGTITKDIVFDISGRAKRVIGLNGASHDGAVITSRSGAAVYTIQMTLKRSETAQNVAEANIQFANLLRKLVQLSSEKEGIIVVPNHIRMHSSIGSPSAYGEIILSVRYNNPEHGDILDRNIKQNVRKYRNDVIHFQIEGSLRRNPMFKSGETERFYQSIKKIGNLIDIRIPEEHRWNASDICYINYNVPGIDGFGPAGDSTHDGNEYIIRHSLVERAALLALIINES